MRVSAATTLVVLTPVVVFLLGLVYLDSYKLVKARTLALVLLAGAGAAGASYGIHVWLSGAWQQDPVTLARYVAPPVEELLKAAILTFYIVRHRVGFLVDAAILGFAVGTGFALVENLYYMERIADAHPAVWLLRGFGTSIMHGGTTAVFGIIAKSLSDRERWPRSAALLPGWIVAVVIHSAYNHFFGAPALSAAAVLLLLPPIIWLVFERSEAGLRSWLGSGFDAGTEMLERIHSGEFRDTPIGRYLQTLKSRFDGPVVADMLCYLRLYVELSLRAKGELMMRQAGFQTAIGDEVRDKLNELRYLEKSIGRTGCLALQPFLQLRSRDLWQFYALGKR